MATRRIDRVNTGEPKVGWQETPHNRKELRRWFERVEDRFMGSPVDLHPHEAILWAMRVSAGEMAYCDSQIAKLEEEELFETPIRTQYYQTEDGGISVTENRDSEQMNRWVTWRQTAMKNMATYAKMALDVGIEERQIQLAEKQAHQLVEVITAVLTDLGHDLRDTRTRDIVRRRLLEGAQTGLPAVVEGQEVA